MDKGFFDDLARVVATPMPRRTLFRTIGAMVAIGVLQRIRPAWASGYVKSRFGCPTIDCGYVRETICCTPVGAYGGYHSTGCCGGVGREDCCVGSNDQAPPNTNPMTWCCPSGTCSGSFKAAGGPCQGRQCNSDEVRCGTKSCCKAGEYCASPMLNRCCVNGASICKTASGSGAVCCKAGTKCCFNAARADCCDPNQTCVNGGCFCGPTMTICGTQCCTKTETCCKTAGGGLCCKAGESCASIPGAPGNKNCCPTARIVVSKAGVPVCCPTGTVDTPGPGGTGQSVCCPPGKPDCCAGKDPLMGIICGAGTVCVDGTCLKY